MFLLVQLVTCLLILALSAPAQTSLEQISTPAPKGFTGIFGGGPFYKTANFNVAKDIAEIEHSGFSEAIVWSVEVNSQGDLNFNGEFPLTSKGVYVGGKTYPKFAADMATLKQGRNCQESHLQHWFLKLRRLGKHHGFGEGARRRPEEHSVQGF